MKPVIPTQKHNDAMKALLNELSSHAKENELLPAMLLACKIAMLARVPYMERIADMEIAKTRAPGPMQFTEDSIELACKAFAEATGYYVEFHKGLRSESSDRIRKGARAALEAAQWSQ